MKPRTYASPGAFKQALDQRLQASAPSKMARARQLVVFDRFLARVVDVLGDAITLKGGIALELRVNARARPRTSTSAWWARPRVCSPSFKWPHGVTSATS